MSPLSTLLNRGRDESADTVEELPLRQAPAVVRVNLLPPEILEAAQFRRAQVVRGAFVAVAAAVVVGGYVLASQSVSSAQSDLDTQQARSAELQSQVQALSHVPQTISAVQAAETRLTGAMGNEVQWSQYLNTLGMRTPTSIGLTEMTVTQDVDAVPAGATTTPAPGTDPATAAAAGGPTVTSWLGNPGLATVTFKGQARNHDNIATFLNRLAANDDNVDPLFTDARAVVDSESNQRVVEFEAGVTVGETARSERYTQKAGE